MKRMVIPVDYGLVADEALVHIRNNELPEGLLNVVVEERSLVDKFIDDGGSAYGFTTFLGHLDNRRISREHHAVLFASQTVGNPHDIPRLAAQSIIYTKIMQCGQGCTGISPSTFQLLTNTFHNTPPASTDLLASYGSGDVAVAALFWESVLFTPGACSIDDLEAGDIIALINGSFIPVGLTLFWMLTHLETLENITRRITSRDPLGNLPATPGVQLPVSMRDTTPLSTQWDTTITTLREAVGLSLSTQSANPLFRHDGRGTMAVSNSSFLNFTLTTALRGLCDTTILLSAYLLGEIRHLAHMWEALCDDPAHATDYIQYPKVCRSYYQHISHTLGIPSGFTQVESLGVEDISDGNLTAITALCDVIPLVVFMEGCRQRITEALGSQGL